MKPTKRHLRIAYKLAIPICLALFALVLWDWQANDSAWLWPLGGVYASFLLILLVMLLIGPAKRVATEERREHILAGEADLPDAISYGGE